MDDNKPYEVGDRVVYRGKTGTIKHIKNSSLTEILVEFDDAPVGYHDGNGVCGIGCGDPGKCRWVMVDSLELVVNQYAVELI